MNNNIEEAPLIRTYQYNAFSEVIAKKHKSYNEWFANHFIQIMYYNNIEKCNKAIDFLVGCIFGSHDLLNVSLINRENLFKDISSCQECLHNVLSCNSYIYTFVNEYYIPNRSAYQKYFYEHDILLCGYENGEYQYMGYDKNKIFVKSSINIEQLYMALNVENEHFAIVELKDTDYIFDINLFTFSLKQYLGSENSMLALDKYLDLSTYYGSFYDLYLEDVTSFGIKCYDKICKLFDWYNDISIHDDLYSYYDIRVLHLLYEHKKSMLWKINYLIINDYLNSNNNLGNRYREIVMQAQIIERMGLKYLINRDTVLNKKIRKGLWDLEQNEKYILKEVLNCIK